MSKKKPKTIDASCPVTLMGCEGEVIVEMTPTEAVSMLEKAWQENKRLRQQIATLTGEAGEARRMYCKEVEHHHETVWNDGERDFKPFPSLDVAISKGWDCFQQEDKPCQ